MDGIYTQYTYMKINIQKANVFIPKHFWGASKAFYCFYGEFRHVLKID